MQRKESFVLCSTESNVTTLIISVSDSRPHSLTSWSFPRMGTDHNITPACSVEVRAVWFSAVTCNHVCGSVPQALSTGSRGRRNPTWLWIWTALWRARTRWSSVWSERTVSNQNVLLRPKPEPTNTALHCTTLHYTGPTATATAKFLFYLFCFAISKMYLKMVNMFY